MENKIKLSDLCFRIEEKMREMQYKPQSIKIYQGAWVKVQRYLPDEYYNEELVARFLQEQCRYELANPQAQFSKSQMQLARAIRVLSDFNRFGTFFRRTHKTPDIIWPTQFKAPVEAFLHNASKSGCSDDWLKDRRREVKYFIEYLDKQNISDLTKILPEHISGYIASQNGYSQSHMSTKLTHLKRFLEFLYLKMQMSI